MFWPMTAVALGLLGLVVLAVPAVRVGLQVRRLARQIDATSQQITRAAAELERSAAVVAQRAGSTGDLPRSESGR